MSELPSDDFTEEERAFLDSPLGKALQGMSVEDFPEETQEAIAALNRGDRNDPVIQRLIGELMIIDATDEIPEDLAWVWEHLGDGS